MMKEKVLYVKLPEDAKYRRSVVTEDGMIAIIYSEAKQQVSCKANINVDVVIPKPKRLIGGTEVYKKDEIPYWYCKIKNGRDEFMYLYMEDLTQEDLYYDSKTGEPRVWINTPEQENFQNNVLKALANKPKEGYRWIPVFEPSSDENGGLQFVKGNKPLVGLNCYEWEKLIVEYSPENESAKSSINTYFLLQLRWLKDGIATLEQLIDNSTNIGHYRNSKNAQNYFELTGEREFGGLYGFIGNTCKIVGDSNSESKFSNVGGNFNCIGNVCPLADVNRISYPDNEFVDSVGLLELKK